MATAFAAVPARGLHAQDQAVLIVGADKMRATCFAPRDVVVDAAVRAARSNWVRVDSDKGAGTVTFETTTPCSSDVPVHVKIRVTRIYDRKTDVKVSASSGGGSMFSAPHCGVSFDPEDYFLWLTAQLKLSTSREAPSGGVMVEAVPLDVLLGDYERSAVEADGIYGGRLIAAKGYIVDLGKDVLGRPYVLLRPEGASGVPAPGYRAPALHCNLAGPMPRGSRLRKGVHAAVRGRVRGLLTHVQVDGCVIE
jgi:hypothetical protein